MNKARILELADIIDGALEESFDMSSFSYCSEPVSCGSPGCIAGWAITVYSPEFDWTRHYLSQNAIMRSAADALDLDDDTAHRLFLKQGATNGYLATTKKAAVMTLRHLAEHGIVDFDLFDEPDCYDGYGVQEEVVSPTGWATRNSEPNLQGIPVRTEEVAAIRAAFLADQG